MSSVIESARPPGPAGGTLPYEYGWRDVVRQLPDGSHVVDRISLTEDDVLHPQDGDVILQPNVHDVDRTYLTNVCRLRVANDPHAEVFCDVGIDWDDPVLRHNSPDVSVSFGVRERGKIYGIFYVAKEGVRPTVLMEVVSPSTRNIDLEDKFLAYHEAEVPYHVIVDRAQTEGPPRILAYRRTPRSYVPLPEDAHGRVWIEPLQLWIGTRDNRVVCYDANEEELGDYAAVAMALAAERERADREKARADAAEALVQAEIQARLALEARLRELEARLGEQGKPPSPANGQ